MDRTHQVHGTSNDGSHCRCQTRIESRDSGSQISTSTIRFGCVANCFLFCFRSTPPPPPPPPKKNCQEIHEGLHDGVPPSSHDSGFHSWMWAPVIISRGVRFAVSGLVSSKALLIVALPQSNDRIETYRNRQ